MLPCGFSDMAASAKCLKVFGIPEVPALGDRRDMVALQKPGLAAFPASVAVPTEYLASKAQPPRGSVKATMLEIRRFSHDVYPSPVRENPLDGLCEGRFFPETHTFP